MFLNKIFYTGLLTTMFMNTWLMCYATALTTISFFKVFYLRGIEKNYKYKEMIFRYTFVSFIINISSKTHPCFQIFMQLFSFLRKTDCMLHKCVPFYLSIHNSREYSLWRSRIILWYKILRYFLRRTQHLKTTIVLYFIVNKHFFSWYINFLSCNQHIN